MKTGVFGAANRQAMSGGARNAPQMAPLLRELVAPQTSSKNLALYFGQLAAMLHSGITIGHAVSIIGQNGPDKVLGQASSEMAPRILSGRPLSICMESYPGIFSASQVIMVSAAERGGLLENMLRRLAAYAEQDYKLEERIKQVTFQDKVFDWCFIIIPAVPVLVLNGLGPFLVVALLRGLGVSSRALFSRAQRFYLPALLQRFNLQYAMDQAKLLIPDSARVTRTLATARFFRTLAPLYTAGIGPGESIRLAAGATRNEVIAESVLSLIPRLERGESLSAVLQSTGYFRAAVLQILKVGEERGTLGEQLDQAAEFLENEAFSAIQEDRRRALLEHFTRR